MGFLSRLFGGKEPTPATPAAAPPAKKPAADKSWQDGGSVPQELAASEVVAMHKAADPPAFLDVREPHELEAAGYIPGSIHIPMHEIQGRTDELDDLYASLTVVAARLDPCFSEGAGESATPCQPQLRVVLQPIRPQRDDPTAPPEARDAALHAFYAGDEHEIVDAARALQGLRIERGVSAYGPLDVSPLLTDAEGRAAVRRVLRPLMTANRLRRVTATTVHANDTAWTFVGLDRDGHEIGRASCGERV